jgi:hypothetical protein
VPTIAARVSWVMLGIATSGFPSFPNCASSQSFLAGIEKVVNQIRFVSDVPRQQICHEQI